MIASTPFCECCLINFKTRIYGRLSSFCSKCLRKDGFWDADDSLQFIRGNNPRDVGISHEESWHFFYDLMNAAESDKVYHRYLNIVEKIVRPKILCLADSVFASSYPQADQYPLAPVIAKRFPKITVMQSDYAPEMKSRDPRFEGAFLERELTKRHLRQPSFDDVNLENHSYTQVD